MHHLSRLSKLFWRTLFAKMGVLFLIVSFFILLTAFIGAVLVMDYNWSMQTAGMVCLAPWIIMIIVVYICYLVAHHRYREEKSALISTGRNAIIIKFIGYMIQFLCSRRKNNTSDH